MLTSRSEYRLILRQDNADERLTPLGHKIGLISEERYKMFEDKQDTIKKEISRCQQDRIEICDKTNEILSKYGEHIDRAMKISELIKRPNIDYSVIKELDEATQNLNYPKEIYEEVENIIKYEGYIKRQQQQIDSADRLEKIKIPAKMDYDSIEQISTETKEKLKKIRPQTLAQATRIGGVKPADISVLMVLLTK